MIIIGGKEKDDSETKTVEEIDFLKRNLVNLEFLKQERCNCQSFLVNDVIYSFGGSKNEVEVAEGEKYSIKENRWR